MCVKIYMCKKYIYVKNTYIHIYTFKLYSYT